MIREIEKTEFGLEGVTDFPLFDTEISVLMEEDVPMEYAEQCAEYLTRMSDATIDQLCDFSIQYCESMREYFEDCEIPIPVNIKTREILEYISPGTLIIEAPEEDVIAFHIEFGCDWEIEHGLEWTVKEGKVMYVGSFNDEGPWRDKEYFKKASWNYAIIED